jgi:ATP-dependent DNA helicase PIF1
MNYIQQLPSDLERFLLDYLTPRDYIAFTGVCQVYRNLRSLQHSSNCAVALTQVLSNVMDRKSNVLIHGPGGSGKTFALSKLFEVACKRNIRVMCTGTTGVSACSLPSGVTIHAFSGLKRGTIPLASLEQQCVNNPDTLRKRYKQWKHIDLLVIDEVSMMGVRFFRLLNYLAQFVRECNRPFGGLQVVFSGDFLQLPPIGDKFVFTCEEWAGLNLTTVPFLAPFRQRGEPSFFRLLSRVRLGDHTARDLEILQDRCIDQVPPELLSGIGKVIIPPFIFSRHAQVNKINQERLKQLPAEPHEVKAHDTFMIMETKYDPVTGTRSSLYVPYTGARPDLTPAFMDRVEHYQPTSLTLKHMGQYIVTQNFRNNLHIVNGTVGLILEKDTHWVFQLKNGRQIPLDMIRGSQCYRVSPTGNLYLRREQYMLRVGYAVTIHSSQGMTLDQAIVDAGSSVFASAQTYVAISRVKRSRDLYLLDFQAKSLKVNREALKFVREIEGIPKKKKGRPSKKQKVTMD